MAVVDLSLNPYIFAALQIQLCMEEYFKYIEGLHSGFNQLIDILGGNMQNDKLSAE